MNLRRSLSIAVVAMLGALSADAAPKSYVVSAPGWGQDQAAAVQAAGGTVTFSHDGTGLGVVSGDAADFADRLRASGAFSSVDEDMVVQWQKPTQTADVDETAINPNDDRFYSTIQWAPQAVGAPAAWAAGYTGSGVRVAILDGGIHSTHVDLVANLDVAASTSFVPGFAFNQDTGTFWHGTHVAGIVAAADNTTGTVGIAPEATLIGVKVLHSGSGSFGGVISGILYASTPLAEGGGGADIINMSLGALFPRGGGNTGAGPLVAAMNKAVNYADRHGVLVVSAAGNDAVDLDHAGPWITVPAESGSGIAVSATGPFRFAYGATNFRRMASYTNYGNSVIHVAAPGGDFAYPGNELCTLPTTTLPVTIPCWAFDMVLSTSRGAGASTTSYSWAAGTSMAAPAASAVAALAKQRHPGISLGALKALLGQSADDEGKKGNDPFYGKGFVNAAKIVE
ncbi:MAG: S8 family serine peptidase [Vicinamibacteria bacterium]